MATIDYATRDGVTHMRRDGSASVPYKVEVKVDLEEVIARKGSAIAASDVIEVINVAPDTLVMAVGIRVDEAVTGTSTDAALDVGITGGDVDAFVDGFDLDAATAGSGSATASGSNAGVLVTDADTIDILVAAQTGTLLTGKIAVWALMLDVGDNKYNPGRAQLGS